MTHAPAHFPSFVFMAVVECYQIPHCCNGEQWKHELVCGSMIGMWRPKYIRFHSNNGVYVWPLTSQDGTDDTFTLQVCNWSVDVRIGERKVWFDIYSSRPDTPLPEDMARQLEAAVLSHLFSKNPHKARIALQELRNRAFCVYRKDVLPGTDISQFARQWLTP